MFKVGVRGHVMIAHSLRGELFGPAQRLHGATYVVDVEFERGELAEAGVVVDIGRAAVALEAVLGEFNYRNLDEHEAVRGQNTTTEFLAKYIFERLCERMAGGELGVEARSVERMRVTLHESHVAWATYESGLKLPI